MKPRLRSLVLVSDNAQIKRPRKKVDGLDQVIKAEQLKTRLFDAFDAAPTRDITRIIGKEGLETFARGLAALHRPANFDWAARFGLSPAPPNEPAKPVAPRSGAGHDPATPQRHWLVKYDGPCANCGTLLREGTPAVWSNAKRKMYCLTCADG